jgi:hypothetical protein
MRVFAVALLTIAVVSALVAATGVQVSSEATAKRALIPAIAALTDTERLLRVHHTEMTSQATEDQTSRIAIPSFPLAVSITATEVQTLPSDELERLVLQRSADIVYREGAAAFREKSDSAGSVLSEPSGGLVATTLNQLTASAHRGFLVALVIMAVFSILLGALLLLGGEPHHGLILAGIGIILAGVIFFIGTTIFIVLLDAARGGSDSSITQLFLAIDRAAVAGGRRNGFVTLILGATLVIFGIFSGVVAARPRSDAYA